MRKILSLALLRLLFTSFVVAQIDTCPIDPYIADKYYEDAYVLVDRELQDSLHPFHDSIDIPVSLLDYPLRALSAVYQTNTTEADSVFNLLQIHAWGSQMNPLNRLLVHFDTTYPWVQQLLDDSNYSGNPDYDNLMASRGFKISHIFSFLSWVLLISPNHHFNLHPLIEQLLQIPGIISCGTDALAGDGSDLWLFGRGRPDSLVFDYGWGDCICGCIYDRFYTFTVNADCNGSFLYVYGDGFPQPVPVTEVINEVTISPNPFSGMLTVTIAGDSQALTEIFSITGSLIHKAYLQGEDLNLSYLEDGLYILIVTGKSGVVLMRKLLIKEAD